MMLRLFVCDRLIVDHCYNMYLKPNAKWVHL